MDVTRTIENLKREGFAVSYFETGKEAATHIAEELEGKTVGIGGSITVEQLGLYERLAKNNTVYWHWKQPKAEARMNAAHAQVYLCSANAIAETGEIINIDGNGNRVASMLYGHEKLILIAGVNKIAEDCERALYRARNVAAPLNARRLNCQTPCALGKEMKCYDCSSADRICNGVVTLQRPMGGIQETEIVLVGESLGY